MSITVFPYTNLYKFKPLHYKATICRRAKVTFRVSPVPELSFLHAPYRGSTRAGERRVQDNLHAHAQSEPIKNY